jgi:hypothetical protein
MSTPRDIHAGAPQISILSPTLYSILLNDVLQIPDVYRGFFVDDTCLYAIHRKKWSCSQKGAANSQCY